MPKDEEQRSLVLSHDSVAAQDNILTYSNTHTKDEGAVARGAATATGEKAISESKRKSGVVNLEGDNRLGVQKQVSGIKVRGFEPWGRSSFLNIQEEPLYLPTATFKSIDLAKEARGSSLEGQHKEQLYR